MSERFESLNLGEGQRDGTRLHLAKFAPHPYFKTLDGKLSVVVSEHWRCAETRLVLTKSDALRLRDWLCETYGPLPAPKPEREGGE